MIIYNYIITYTYIRIYKTNNYIYSLKDRQEQVCLKPTIPSSRASGVIESTTFAQAVMVCDVSMRHLQSLKNTLCKCNPVERGGPGANVAHSPGLFEMSLRLIVFELLGG